MGGNILCNNRVQAELKITRAFGNLEHKKFIISDPEVTQCQLTSDDDLLILASDGIF